MTVILIILAFAANAVMDKIQFHWRDSVFCKIKNTYWYHFWNPKLSWMNKWKMDKDHHLIKKNGRLVERFWGSSRWFVFLTDGWHLMKFVQVNSLVLAVAHNTAQFLAYNEQEAYPYWVFLPFIFIVLRGVGGIWWVFLFDVLLKRKITKTPYHEKEGGSRVL